MISSDPWTWLAGLLTLSILSMLYKETKIFRWAQYTYIGVVVGHDVVTGISTLTTRFTPLFTGANYSLILTFILGVMSLFVAWRKFSWVASIPIAIMVGVGTALSLYAQVRTDIVRSILSTLTEATQITGVPMMTAVANIARIVITVLAMFYFLFTIRLKGPSSRLTTISRYILFMIFGFTVGNSLTSYNTYFVTSLKRILTEWLGIGV